MKRSKRKGPFLLLNENYIKKNSTITKTLISNKYNVYDGKKFVTIFIDKHMVGYKIGEFLNTKINFKFKKK